MRELDLFHDYQESGFDGKYERTTRYRLIVGEGNRNASATLEVEVEERTFPEAPENPSLTRYQIGIEDLVRLIEKHGTRVAGQ